MNSLKNKNIIVTGASGGIGNSIVEKLHAKGANILATGTRIDKLEELKSNFSKIKIATNKGDANFLLINFNRVRISSEKVFKLLAKKGILVRQMNVYGITNSLRVTIGTANENKNIISQLEKIINV